MPNRGICQVAGCDRQVWSKGLCNPHYCKARYRPRPRPVVPVMDRFWSWVDDSGDCWEWTGALNERGYGRFKLDKTRHVAAHRFAWEITNQRPIPDGLLVLHHCDNRRCTRPDHLWLGTQQDNIDDMIAKGRDNFGGKKSRSA